MFRVPLILVFTALVYWNLSFAGDVFRVVKIDTFPYRSENVRLYLAAGKCIDKKCSRADESKAVFYKIDALKCLYTFSAGKITEVALEVCLKLYELDTENALRISRLPVRLLVRSKEAMKGSKYIEFYWISGHLAKQNLHTVDSCDEVYCYAIKQTNVRIEKITPDKFEIAVSNARVSYDNGTYIYMHICLNYREKAPRICSATRSMAKRMGYYESLTYKLKANITLRYRDNKYSYNYIAYIKLPVKANSCYPVKIFIRSGGPISNGTLSKVYMTLNIEDEKFLDFEPIRVVIDNE